MWIPGMLIFWVGISAVFFRWTKDEYASWGGGKGKKALAGLILLLAGVPKPALAQDTIPPTSQDPPPPSVDWSVDTEVGASAFFGAKDQTTVASKLGLVRVGEAFEVETDLSFLYGESTDDQGDNFVNKRSWEVASNVDYRGFSRANPYFFGSVLASLEKKIDRRYKGGVGAKFTLLDSEVSRLDLALAIMGEKTFEADGGNGDEEFLGRWTGAASYRRSFSDDRAVFEAGVDYNPGFRTFDNFTFEAEGSLAFRLSEIVSLKLSVEDNYDNRAKDRGALSNNDGRVLFSVLASF
jgi:hypothetical protein